MRALRSCPARRHAGLAGPKGGQAPLHPTAFGDTLGEAATELLAAPDCKDEWTMQTIRPDFGTIAETDFRFYFDHSAELLCAIDPAYCFSIVNPAWERLLGWSQDEMCGVPMLDFVHPDDRHATREVMQRVADGRARGFFVNRYRGRDGAYRRLQWRFARPTPTGGTLAVAHDITEEQRRLTHAETVERATGVGTWEIDVETQELFWSTNAFRIHDLDPEAGHPTLDEALARFPDSARAHLTEAEARLLNQGEGFDLELPSTTVTGRAIWVHVTGMAEMNGDKPARVFGTIRDVTEARERRLWRERLSAVAQYTTNGVLVLDRRLRVEWMNPAFERQSGHRLDAVKGRRGLAVLGNPHPEGARVAEITAALLDGRSVRTELARVRADGATYWVDVNIEPVRDVRGTITGYVAVETDITAARQNADRLAALEQEARAAHDRLIDAMEALPDAFVLFDHDDRLVLCNERYREFYAETAPVLVPGVSFEEIERYALAHAQLPDAEGREEAWLTERLAGRSTGGTTLHQRLPDGRFLRTVERRTRTGELVAFHTDITELRRQREEAEAAGKALQATLDAIPDLLFEVDLDGAFHQARDGTSSRLQWPAEEYRGKTLHDALSHESAEKLLAAFRELLATGAGPSQVLEVFDHVRWFEVSIAQMAPRSGKPHFLLTARDITERKALDAERAQNEAELAAANARLEKALRERDAAETRFFDIASVSRDWFWEQDAELRFTFVSESVREIGGLSPEAHIGRTREELAALNPDVLDSADWDWLRARTDAREPFKDFVYRHPAVRDRITWVRISGAPVFDDDGSFRGYRGVGSDVTALYEARLRAEEASAAKSRFLANMSHEIRTPLNGIMGMAAVLEDRVGDGEAREMIAVIRESGETLVTILNDILDFSKIEAGLMELEIGEFSPADLARRVASLHRLKAEEKGLRFDVIAGAGADVPRRGDGHRILQILHNLVGNAIKFTAQGEVRVLFSTTPVNITIEVRDTGIGLSEVQLARVFDEFVQGDSSITRKHGGAGLGLSITRRLVELMGGQISMKSAPGIGTRAVVRLPLPIAEAPAEAPRSAVSASTAASPLDQGNLRALVADDNATNRLLMGKFLDRLGIGAHIVACGRDAVQAAAEEDFDLLLLDISMPDMTGIEVLADIRAADAAAGRPRRPAIAVTANAMHHQVVEYLAAGFDGHVGKPIDPDVLAAGIEAVITGRDPAAPGG
jgi:PAS domain S-box-containing protein